MVQHVIKVCTGELLVPLGKQDLHLYLPAASDLPKSGISQLKNVWVGGVGGGDGGGGVF